MHTQTHTSATDRRQEPRRLLPRRPAAPYANNPKTIARYMEHLRGQNPARFRAGDYISFAKTDGGVWPILILEIRGKDVDAICYDGNPHLLRLTVTDLDTLRIVRIEDFGLEAVDMYRGLVGLDIDEEVAA